MPRRLVRLLATLVYRDIDLRLPTEAFPDGPTLAVANHFGGLSDGVLLIDSAPRMPRVIARDLIWKVPVVGWLASAAGMIPVHRAADGGKTSNDRAFASAYDALAHDELLLIFPEGVTQDVPYMAEVHTGAARIVLGARRAGVRGVTVVPMGIHYENKAGFRSRALVNIGDAIDVDPWCEARPGGVADGAEDRDAVVALTERIDMQLRRVAPDFPDWDTATALETVAEVMLDDVDPRPADGTQYGDRSLIADRLNRLPEPTRAEIVGLGREYRDALIRAGVSDGALVERRPEGRHPWRRLGQALLVLLLLPYAVLGFFAALLPLLLVVVVSRLPIAPAVRATVVPGVALLSFLAVWILFAAQALTNDVGLGLAAVLLFPMWVAAMFYVVERIALMWRGWRSRRRPSPSDRDALLALRQRLADCAWEAV